MGNNNNKNMESDLANRVGDQFEQNNFCHKQSFILAMVRKTVCDSPKPQTCSFQGRIFVEPILNIVFLKNNTFLFF